MGIIEILLTSFGVSMDAFAVSVCKGLSLKKFTLKNSLLVGSYFGFFQALMPTIGFFIGRIFQKTIEAYDHWVAFILLLVIGLNMIKDL